MRLGEPPDTVFAIGSPELDVHARPSGVTIDEVRRRYEITAEEYGVVIFHPVTSEIDTIGAQAEALLGSLTASRRRFVLILPNNDPGSDDIVGKIRRLPAEQFRTIPSMRFNYFSELLKNAAVLVGNSSAGVREAPFLGIPSLDVGTRQTNRSSAPSVASCSAGDGEAIGAFLDREWNRRYPPHGAFGEGGGGGQVRRGARQTLNSGLDSFRRNFPTTSSHRPVYEATPLAPPAFHHERNGCVDPGHTHSSPHRVARPSSMARTTPALRLLRMVFGVMWKLPPLRPLLRRWWPAMPLQIANHIMLLHPSDNYTERFMWRRGERTEAASVGRLTLLVAGKRSLVFDIGANCGLYTVALSDAAASGSRIVAFEPNPVMASRLRTNLALNNLEHVVELEEVAIGQENDTARLHFNKADLGGASMIADQDSTSTLVPVRSLAAYLPEQPSNFDIFVGQDRRRGIRRQGAGSIPRVHRAGRHARRNIDRDEAHRVLVARSPGCPEKQRIYFTFRRRGSQYAVCPVQESASENPVSVSRKPLKTRTELRLVLANPTPTRDLQQHAESHETTRRNRLNPQSPAVDCPRSVTQESFAILESLPRAAASRHVADSCRSSGDSTAAACTTWASSPG